MEGLLRPIPRTAGRDRRYLLHRVPAHRRALLPPTTTVASPTATLPLPTSTSNCSRNWSGEDTSCRSAAGRRPRCTSVVSGSAAERRMQGKLQRQLQGHPTDIRIDSIGQSVKGQSWKNDTARGHLEVGKRTGKPQPCRSTRCSPKRPTR